MKKHLFYIVKLSLFGLILTSVPVIANAAGSVKFTGEKTVTVSYADLDMTRAEGVKVFYRRLKNAANQVCGVHVGDLEMLEVITVKNKCVKSAMAEAVKSVHNDQLDALYYKKDNLEQKS